MWRSKRRASTSGTPWDERGKGGGGGGGKGGGGGGGGCRASGLKFFLKLLFNVRQAVQV